MEIRYACKDVRKLNYESCITNACDSNRHICVYRVNLNDSSGVKTLYIERYAIHKDGWQMTRYIQSLSFKDHLVDRGQERIIGAWQKNALRTKHTDRAGLLLRCMP